MMNRLLTILAPWAAALTILSLAPAPVKGQTAARATPLEKTTSGAQTPKTWTPPRTLTGEPDLQGVWDFRTVTPLQRPKELEGKEFLTDDEVAKVEEQGAQLSRDRPPREG